MQDTLKFIELGTKILIAANVATPIIFGTISAIAAIIKGVTGSGPTLRELAGILEAQIGTTDRTIRAEIARLEALTPPVPPAT